MQIRVLEDRDQPRLEAFLCAHADSSMFLRSNARLGLHNRGERLQGAYVGAFDGKSLVGVVAHFNQGNMIPQAPVPLLPRLVRRALAASGRALAGTVGPADQVDALLRAAGAADAPRRLDTREGLYGLELSGLRRPRALAAQRISARVVTPADATFLIDWFCAYDVECLGATPGAALVREAEADFARVCERAVGYLLLRDGQPVAYSAFNATLPDTVQIGGVYTPPAERNKGFARSVVAYSLECARQCGVTRALLFTGEENVPAITAYRALGFSRVGDFRLTLLH